MSSSPPRRAALQAFVWTVSAAAAGGSLLLLCYEWVRATGQFVRLAVLAGGLDPDAAHRAGPDRWLALLAAVVFACCIVQLRLWRAVRLRKRLVDTVSPHCLCGRWALARLVRGARLWPEALCAACMLMPPLVLALLLQRARDSALQTIGAWWDPRSWAGALSTAIHLQLEDLVLGGALCTVSVTLGMGMLALLVTWRLRIHALRAAARALRAEEPPRAHPYRGLLLSDKAAMQWVAAPGPGSWTAVAGAGAVCVLTLAPGWWATARYASEFFVEFANGSPSSALLARLAVAEAELAGGFLVAALGSLVCWTAGLAVFALWALRRWRAAPRAGVRHASSLRATVAVAIACSAITALALPFARQYRAENGMSFPQVDRRVGTPPGMRPDGFPYVTAFDPVVMVHQDRYEVDGAALEKPSALRDKLSQYRRNYPGWAAGQERFVVVAARRDTPMGRIREALSAAHDAGYELAFFPAEHDCRVDHRPILGDLWDCRVSTGRIALAGDAPQTGPWQAAVFGEFSERVMGQGRGSEHAKSR